MVLRSNFVIEEAELRFARQTLNSVHHTLSRQTTSNGLYYSPHSKALKCKLGDLERSWRITRDSCLVRKQQYQRLTQQLGYCVPGDEPRRAAQDNLRAIGRIIAEAQEIMNDLLAHASAKPVEVTWWSPGESSNSSFTSVGTTSRGNPPSYRSEVSSDERYSRPPSLVEVAHTTLAAPSLIHINADKGKSPFTLREGVKKLYRRFFGSDTKVRKDQSPCSHSSSAKTRTGLNGDGSAGRYTGRPETSELPPIEGGPSSVVGLGDGYAVVERREEGGSFPRTIRPAGPSASPPSAEMVQASTSPSRTVPTPSCVVCGDTLKAKWKHFLITPCSHLYCPGCTKQYLAAYARDESLHPLSCCNQPIPKQNIDKVLLKSDEYQKFQRKFEEYETHPKERVYCPAPKCSKFIPARYITTTRKPHYICPFCSRKICKLCKGPAHPGKGCDAEGQNALFKELVGKEGWHTCRCGRTVERVEGCPHMRCLCRRPFCYNCGARYKGPKHVCGK